MAMWFFASDLHGRADRYRKLFRVIAREGPAVVLLGGDLLPSGLAALRGHGKAPRDFMRDFLIAGLTKLRASLGSAYGLSG